MNDTPLISIIVAAYNAQSYIDECLQSIEVQTYPNFEVIIVDDGSDDGTVQCAGKFAERDQRFRVIRNDHVNAGHARNTGIRAAAGEYLAFIDADDRLHDDYLEVLLRGCTEHDADICVCHSQSFDDVTGEVRDIDYAVKQELLPDKNPFHYTDACDTIFLMFNGWAWDKLFRTEMVRKHKLSFQSLRTTNDMYFVDMAYIYANRIYVTKETLIDHRENNRNALSKTREKSYRCFYDALLALRSKLLEEGVFEKVQRSYFQWAADFTAWNISTIRGASFRKLYELMHMEGIGRLGILELDESNYKGRHKDFYAFCRTVAEQDYDTYIAARGPMLSIIIPVYNTAWYIGECLDSILQSDCSEIEIICIDDGSTDASPAILHRYASVNPEVQAYTISHAGISGARNYGLAKAKGRYIQFIDSDDKLTPDTISSIITVMEREWLDVCFFGAHSFYETPQLKEKYPVYEKNYIRQHLYPGVRSAAALYEDLNCHGEWRVCVTMQVFRREFLNRYGITFREGIIHEDNLFTFETTVLAQRAMCLPDNFYLRRIREGSVMTQKVTFENARGYTACMASALDFLLGCPDDAVNRQAAGQLLDNMAMLSMDTYLQLSPQEQQRTRDSLTAAEYCLFYELLSLRAKAEESKTQGEQRVRGTITFRIGAAILWLPEQILKLLHIYKP